tara:strand:+ start:10092 stop:10358 length:267 start_codon:yes stop_codon:yes gene_type:complete
MKNPFEGYRFKEEDDREEILENFKFLFKLKKKRFPSLKLLMVYNAFKSRLLAFDMSLSELKTHLDALAEAPDCELMKTKDEYHIGDLT